MVKAVHGFDGESLVGARGKKRRRQDGSVANGKLPAVGMPPPVPQVEADQVQSGLARFRKSLADAGSPTSGSEEWHAAYRDAQQHLHTEHGWEVGDAILWRATFLDALVRGGEFQKDHAGERELPTPAMYEVAAFITTYGDERSFDRWSFEAHLADDETIAA